MIFKNRKAAAILLSEKLRERIHERPLVLAIPRGAITMASLIAENLEGDLDVVLVRKIGAPYQEELAIGAIDETGHCMLNRHVQDLQISEKYIEAKKQEQLELIRARRKLYTPDREPISPTGREVIIIDDGIATGSTMLAAIGAIRARKPKRIIVATAVAPRDTLDRLMPQVDDMVCLYVPPQFYAVGQFFEDFAQVSDEEVIQILKTHQSQSQIRGDTHARHLHSA